MIRGPSDAQMSDVALEMLNEITMGQPMNVKLRFFMGQGSSTIERFEMKRDVERGTQRRVWTLDCALLSTQ